MITVRCARASRLASFVAAIYLAASAQALVVQTNRIGPFGARVDFGQGFHAFGEPSERAIVTWEFFPGATSVSVRVRLTGTLYVDSFGPARVRLTARFKDGLGNVLSTETRFKDGPGWNANDPANQRAIDFAFQSTSLRQIEVLASSGPSGGPTTLESGDEKIAFLVNTPASTFPFLVNNGTADFGSGSHNFGGPASPGIATIGLGAATGATQVVGRVAGTLYHDSFSAGESQILMRWLDADGVILHEETATATSRKASSFVDSVEVNRSFSSPRLFSLRVFVGQLVLGVLLNAERRDFFVSQTLGTVELVPSRPVAAGETLKHRIIWTVPEPFAWRSLNSMDIRLMDGGKVAYQLHWEEPGNTFSMVKPNGNLSEPALPGDNRRFESDFVTCLMKETGVVGSGPTGTTVALDLALRFKPGARGRRYEVLVSASGDFGQNQLWSSAGSIKVLPKE